MSTTMTVNDAAAAQSDARAGKYLTFQLSNEEFGIRVLKVREIMGLQHRKYPIHGVQFHPESFLTESGIELLKNFLKIAGEI